MACLFLQTKTNPNYLKITYIAETFTPHPDIQIPEHTDLVKRYLYIPLPLHLPFKHFTPNKIKFVIQKYSLKKLPGYDLITAEVARYLPKRKIVLLTIILMLL